jgi:hypothetical protein
MKNLIKLSVLFSIIVLFISSCGSRLTIEKRQHSKGYYVSHNNTKHTISTAPNKIVKTETEVNTPLIEIENPTTIQHSTVNIPIAVTEEAKLEIVQSNPNEKVTEVREIEKTTPTNLAHNIENKPENKTRSVISARKNNVKTILSKNSIESEVYSLLWIVIVVLLILWALGLISGFGATGLIHILLVIALILLILWLLRII